MLKKVLLSLLLLCLSFPAHATDKKESVFDRIMRTKEIRCGYAVWDPALYIDGKTGEMKGFAYDLMEILGQRLDLKIIWAEETGWGTIVEGLHTGRYDMICTGLAASSARAKFIDFSTPYLYLPIYVVGRADDTRFDKGYGMLDDPQYKIAVLEGEMSAILARQLFPKATANAMPQIQDYSMLLKEVEAKKSDVTFVEPETFLNYTATNPGKLRIIDEARPLNTMPGTYGLPHNEPALRRMVDVTINEMIQDGTVAKLIHKYEKHPGTMLLPALPYQPAKK